MFIPKMTSYAHKERNGKITQITMFWLLFQSHSMWTATYHFKCFIYCPGNRLEFDDKRRWDNTEPCGCAGALGRETGRSLRGIMGMLASLAKHPPVSQVPKIMCALSALKFLQVFPKFSSYSIKSFHYIGAQIYFT